MPIRNTSGLRVVLVNCGQAAGKVIAGKRMMSLTTIKAGLHARGFEDVHLLPEQEGLNFGLPVDLARLQTELHSICRDADQVVIGFSTTSEDMAWFLKASSMVKKEFPDVKRVVGGPGVVREEPLYLTSGRRILDPVEQILGRGFADAAVWGDAAPFVELICDHAGDISAVHSPGFYCLDGSEKVVGTGRGRYPSVEAIPYLVEGDRVSIITSSGCPNSCGYCSINKGSFGFSQAMIVSALREIYTKIGGRANALLKIDDSNPFAFSGQNSLQAAFNHLTASGIEDQYNIPKSAFFDPTLFIGPGSIQLFLKLIKLGVVGYYFGFETTSVKVAAKIGVKAKRNGIQVDLPLSQEDIRNTAAAILGLGRILRDNFDPIYGKPVYRIKISLMATPFDNRETLLRACDLIGLFDSLSGGVLTVIPTITPLFPFPGTWVRRQYLDLIREPDSLTALGDISQGMWKPEIGDGIFKVLNSLSEHAREDLSVEWFRGVIEGAF
ncbi:MAG: hypothetical protein WC890_02535 [Candidatus Margulisiibacteriota bacterium]